MAHRRRAKGFDKVVKLKLEAVLAYAKSITDQGDNPFDTAGEYLHKRYPRGCEVIYRTGKIFVGGSPQDIAIALQLMKYTLDAGSRKGVSQPRIRYTEEELRWLKRKKKPKKSGTKKTSSYKVSKKKT